MEGLVLKSGGCLEYTRWVYDKDEGEGAYAPHDVTRLAIRYLFEPVTLAEDVVLRDVFALLAANPMLFEVYRRDWAEELTREALETPSTRESPDSDIEYLEVYRDWGRDSDDNTLERPEFVEFHGVGPVLTEDVLEQGHLLHKAGTRVRWSLSFLSPAKLVGLPLRVNALVTVSETGTRSDRYGETLDQFVCPRVTLGQLIYGIVWELSFHGPARERDAQRDSLVKQVQELREQRSE